MIEKEAEGKAYYSDYPPKEVDLKSKKKKKGELDESQKIKKLYEDLIE